MATIIAGRFEQQTHVLEASEALMRAGFDEERISSFYMTPVERRATVSIEEGRIASEGARHTPKGLAAGGTIGAAVGLAASPLAGPAGIVGGALLGAHVGNLIGALSQTDDAENSPPIRHSGMMVAVEVHDASEESRVIDVLNALGAQDLERAEGTIENGDWEDFNPVSTPSFVGSASH